MHQACQRSWGSPQKGFWFCTRERGHEGNCINIVYGGKKPDDRFFEEQPDAIAANAKQREDERKMIAKKAGAPLQ